MAALPQRVSKAAPTGKADLARVKVVVRLRPEIATDGGSAEHAGSCIEHADAHSIQLRNERYPQESLVYKYAI